MPDTVGHIENTDEPFNKGRRAARAGVALNLNPCKGQSARSAWKKGWKSVRFEMRHTIKRNKHAINRNAKIAEDSAQ